MFHLMLVLPVLGPLLAVYGVIVAVILCLPFWVGLGLQAILTAVTEKKQLLVLPTVLSWICVIGYFFWFRGPSLFGSNFSIGRYFTCACGSHGSL